MTSHPVPVRTVVLVHGAWHGAWCWAGVQAELDRRGIPSLAVDLPGHGASTAPPTDLHGDAATVARLLARLPGEVVLVGHSYGGAVITEAATGAPNVAHLVYVTAFALDEGESVVGFLASLPRVPLALDRATVAHDDGTTTLDPELARQALFAECASEPVVTAALARLGPQAKVVFTQAMHGAAWRTIDATYVRCTRDEAIHISHQDVMAQRCDHVVTLETDHSPALGIPEVVAGIIEPLARPTNGTRSVGAP